MPKKSVATTTYSYTLREIKELFAKELKVDIENVTVTYKLVEKEDTSRYADPRDNNNYTVVTGLTVKVKI